MKSTVAGAAPLAMLARWRAGEAHLGTALGRLTDDDFDGPSLLPGWTRHILLAHLARNADALLNLLTWARTGIETPMYPSPGARQEQLAATAASPPAQLRRDVVDASRRLALAMDTLPDEAWAASVRTAQGRSVPAAEVPWLRAREAWAHGVDLDAGITFAPVPTDVTVALIDDVFRTWARRDAVPDLILIAGDHEWGTGSVAVAGSLPAAAAWVTGRSAGTDLTADGALPRLPNWI
jgi:maleylpyruvate isomerase